MEGMKTTEAKQMDISKKSCKGRNEMDHSKMEG
jgi:hypothetical protein